MNDSIKTIRYSAQKFFSGTFLSRITGMLRDVSMAYAFGTHSSVAAFMLAFRLAHSLRRLLGEGALQSAFIPEFEALRHHSPQQAFSFFRNLVIALALLLITITLFSAGLLSAFLFWGNPSPENREIINLTLILLPSLFFICLYGIYASLLQCEKIYFIPSASPIAFNVIWICAVFLLYKMPANEAMPYLACGVIVACIAQWLCTFPQTWYILRQSLPPFRWSSFQLNSPDLRRLGQRLTLGIVGVAASQINNVVDSIFALLADPEGPAFLWYAIRIQQLPLALFGVALAGAILPPISRAIKAHKTEEFHQFLQYAIKSTWLFMLPLTAILIIMGDQIIHTVFARGGFGYQSTVETTYCLWAYCLGLIPSTLIIVLASACYAQNNYRTPAIISLTAMVLNLFLNSVFILLFHLGPVSVALATSISAWLNLYLLYRNLPTNGTQPSFYRLPKEVVVIMFNTALCASATLWFRFYILQFPLLSEEHFSSISFFQQSLLLISNILLFSSLTFVLHYLIRILANLIKGLDVGENCKILLAKAKQFLSTNLTQS